MPPCKKWRFRRRPTYFIFRSPPFFSMTALITKRRFKGAISTFSRRPSFVAAFEIGVYVTCEFHKSGTPERTRFFCESISQITPNSIICVNDFLTNLCQYTLEHMIRSFKSRFRRYLSSSKRDTYAYAVVNLRLI